MASLPQPSEVVRFGTFAMDVCAGKLTRNGHKIDLEPQPFAILAVLVRRAPDVVIREELYSILSKPGYYDYKHGLNTAIQKIREALSDSAADPRFIETIRGRGYCFLPSVARENCLNSASNDAFWITVSRIRQDLLSAFSQPELNKLLYQARSLMDQYREHPDRYQIGVLMNEVQKALNYSSQSETNRRKHRLGFETAGQVFDDQQALSFVDESGLWHTLGQVVNATAARQQMLVTVSHYVLTGENSGEQVQIRSARKATRIERKMYEQNQSKSGK